MKRILVLQNHRIGDLIQSTPVLFGLREKHHPCHITLVVNRMRADVNLGELADEVIAFDQNGFVDLFRDPAKSIVEKYDHARRFLDQFTRGGFDLVIDIPADAHMHLIASMLQDAAEVRGVVLSPSRTWRHTHPEVRLLYTIGLCREVNRFSLVDFQNLLSGVRPSANRLHLPIRREDEEHADSLLAAAGADPGRDLIVALQAGASEERKRWGEARFARLAQLLSERLRAKVLLTGSESEKRLTGSIASQVHAPVIDAAGRTDIGGLAALLRRCRVLVTNDTGTMHVATAAGTPVIDLSTGPVYFRETGPYAADSVVVEADMSCSPCSFNAVCHDYRCRERIEPEMIFQLVEVLVRGAGWASLSQARFQGVRLHRSHFNDVGRLEFLPVFRYPVTWYQFLGFFYAHLWEVFYGLRATPLGTAQILEHIGSCHALHESWDSIREEAGRGLEELRRLESDLRAARTALRPVLLHAGTPSPARQVRALEELQKIFEKLQLFGRIRPSVRHFTGFLEMAISSESGAEPVSAIRNIDASFRFALEQVSFLRLKLDEASALLDTRTIAASPPYSLTGPKA